MTTTNRETWLNDMAAKMAPRFEELGKPLPKFLVSIGFTSKGANSSSTAEVWNAAASSDGSFQIYIRPDTQDSMRVACSLAHELTHAAVGFEHGHKGEFARIMKELGMVRPFTSTNPSEKATAWIGGLIEQLGPIPHAALHWPGSRAAAPARKPAPDAGGDQDGGDQDGGTDEPVPASSNAKKKQGTRMIKCACGECGYTVRTTAKWLEVGPPCCPLHGPMQADGSDQ